MSKENKKGLFALWENAGLRRGFAIISILAVIGILAALIVLNTNKNDKSSSSETESMIQTGTDAETDAASIENTSSAVSGIRIDDVLDPEKTGEILYDGSAGVGLITELAAESFNEFYKNIQINVGVSGSDKGISKLIAGDIDICGSLRQMNTAERSSAGEVIEMKLAYEAIVIVVNVNNTWLNEITVDELRSLWDAGKAIGSWKDVNSDWKDETVRTFMTNETMLENSFFFMTLYGKNITVFGENNTALDYSSEMIDQITAESGSIGFCSYKTYVDNADKLKALWSVTDKGPAEPTVDNIRAGLYAPFSRLFYLYIKTGSLEKDYIKSFLNTYIDNANKFVTDAGYLPMEDPEYQKYSTLINN